MIGRSYDNNDNDSDSDSDNSDHIDISDGLSADTLNALLAFMNPASVELGGGLDVDNLDSLPAPPSDNNGKISDKSLVAAFTPKDINVIAETLARLQAQSEKEERENPKVGRRSHIIHSTCHRHSIQFNFLSGHVGYVQKCNRKISLRPLRTESCTPLRRPPWQRP